MWARYVFQEVVYASTYKSNHIFSRAYSLRELPIKYPQYRSYCTLTKCKLIYLIYNFFLKVGHICLTFYVNKVFENVKIWVYKMCRF